MEEYKLRVDRCKVRSGLVIKLVTLLTSLYEKNQVSLSLSLSVCEYIYIYIYRMLRVIRVHGLFSMLYYLSK